MIQSKKKLPYSSKFSWHKNFVKWSKFAKLLIFVVKISWLLQNFVRPRPFAYRVRTFDTFKRRWSSIPEAAGDGTQKLWGSVLYTRLSYLYDCMDALHWRNSALFSREYQRPWSIRGKSLAADRWRWDHRWFLEISQQGHYRTILSFLYLQLERLLRASYY